MVIDLELLKELKKSGLSLEEYIILYSKYFNVDWLYYYYPLDISYFKLKRMFFLDSSNTLTPKAMDYMFDLSTQFLKVEEESFKSWWTLYPSDDAWGLFQATRKIRSNKPRAKRLFASLLKEGITVEQLSKALLSEIAFKKKTSKPGNNNLTFLQSPPVWLYNRSFELWENKEDETEDTQKQLYGKELE